MFFLCKRPETKYLHNRGAALRRRMSAVGTIAHALFFFLRAATSLSESSPVFWGRLLRKVSGHRCCKMILGVAAASVVVAVFSLFGLGSPSKPTCVVSLTHPSLHLILYSGVLGVNFCFPPPFFFPFRKETHMVSLLCLF